MDKLEQLLAYIHDHGHSAYASLLDNVLHCEAVYTYKTSEGIQAGADWENVQPTTYAVRNWLGY